MNAWEKTNAYDISLDGTAVAALRFAVDPAQVRYGAAYFVEMQLLTSARFQFPLIESSTPVKSVTFGTTLRAACMLGWPLMMMCVCMELFRVGGVSRAERFSMCAVANLVLRALNGDDFLFKTMV